MYLQNCQSAVNMIPPTLKKTTSESRITQTMQAIPEQVKEYWSKLISLWCWYVGIEFWRTGGLNLTYISSFFPVHNQCHVVWGRRGDGYFVTWSWSCHCFFSFVLQKEAQARIFHCFHGVFAIVSFDSLKVQLFRSKLLNDHRLTSVSILAIPSI